MAVASTRMTNTPVFKIKKLCKLYAVQLEQLPLSDHTLLARLTSQKQGSAIIFLSLLPHYFAISGPSRVHVTVYQQWIQAGRARKMCVKHITL